MMQCEQVKEDGMRCGAQCVIGDSFCFAHTAVPEVIERRHEGQIMGGKNGRKLMLPPAEDTVSVKNPRDILTLLERTINDLRQQRITTGEANSIAILANVMSRIHQQEVLETRIAVLERTVIVTERKVR